MNTYDTQPVHYLNLEYFFNKIYEFIVWIQEVGLHTNGNSLGFFYGLRIIFFVVSFLLLCLIIYYIYKTFELREEEHENLHHAVHFYTHANHNAHTQSADTSGVHNAGNASPLGDDLYVSRNPRWQTVENYAASDNPGDWRLGIIEADLMLEELLEEQGFSGATLGEKLKNAERGDFVTYQNAWEAHKVRNNIAHLGSEFNLSANDARRTVLLYKTVFEEFNYI